MIEPTTPPVHQPLQQGQKLTQLTWIKCQSTLLNFVHFMFHEIEKNLKRTNITTSTSMAEKSYKSGWGMWGANFRAIFPAYLLFHMRNTLSSYLRHVTRRSRINLLIEMHDEYQKGVGQRNIIQMSCVSYLRVLRS